MADTGWTFVGTGADDNRTGTAAWSNPGNITADDASVAQTITSFSSSHYLKGTNLGFSIPSGADIDGIECRMEAHLAVGTEAINTIKIVKADDSIGTTNKASGTLTTTPTVFTFGGAADLWDETWAPSDINDVDFGFVFSTATGSKTYRFDYFAIKVYYTPPPSGGGLLLLGVGS